MTRRFMVTFYITDDDLVPAAEAQLVIADVVLANLIEGNTPVQGFEPDELTQLTVTQLT